MSEARDLLQGERRVVYDYVTVHRGIYGDDVEVSPLVSTWFRIYVIFEAIFLFSFSR